MAEFWDLLFTLPNLAVPIPTPFATGGYAVCSGDDPRLENLADSAGNATSRKMLGRFTTARGEGYKPACFMIRSDRRDDVLPRRPVSKRVLFDYLRSDLKPARTSSEKSCGCSQAAKCPPLATLL